ncbi:hypothetical protein LZ32DRAFT_317674 [Colletotrichum eremochloae]|nr:hypothetical protein LZ32DRAFT_317674 [Colletotrichum eremochloae]
MTFLLFLFPSHINARHLPLHSITFASSHQNLLAHRTSDLSFYFAFFSLSPFPPSTDCRCPLSTARYRNIWRSDQPPTRRTKSFREEGYCHARGGAHS